MNWKKLEYRLLALLIAGIGLGMEIQAWIMPVRDIKEIFVGLGLCFGGASMITAALVAWLISYDYEEEYTYEFSGDHP